MGLIDNIKENARKQLRTIVLPESEDERVLQATAQVLADKTANIVLIGDAQKIKSDADACGANIEGAQIIDPKNFENIEKYINELVELRAKKGLSKEDAAVLMTTEPRFLVV